MSQPSEQLARIKTARRACGMFLHGLRLCAGLAQADVSRALGYQWSIVLGTHEQGTTFPDPTVFDAYARCVGMDPALFRSVMDYYWMRAFTPEETNR